MRRPALSTSGYGLAISSLVSRKDQHPASIGTSKAPAVINESELLNRLGESLHAIEFL